MMVTDGDNKLKISWSCVGWRLPRVGSNRAHCNCKRRLHEVIGMAGDCQQPQAGRAIDMVDWPLKNAPETELSKRRRPHDPIDRHVEAIPNVSFSSDIDHTISSIP